MKIGITSEIKENYKIEDSVPDDRFSELVINYTIKFITRLIKRLGHDVEFIGDKYDLLKKLSIHDSEYDLIFNMAEGLVGRNREGEIPTILDIYNIPYVGSDPVILGLTLDKKLSKRLLQSANIPTPKGYDYIRKDNDICIDIPKNASVIVKCSMEGSSIGLKQDSVSNQVKQIKQHIRYIEDVYKQEALVEEYIDGQEYSVMVIGNGDNLTVFEPVKIFFKNENDSIIYNSCNVDIEISKDIEINNKLKAISKQVFKLFSMRDICRIDYRENNGNVYVIDINCIPSYDQNTHFTVIGNYLGIGHRGMLDFLLNTAMERIENEQNE